MVLQCIPPSLTTGRKGTSMRSGVVATPFPTHYTFCPCFPSFSRPSLTLLPFRNGWTLSTTIWGREGVMQWFVLMMQAPYSIEQLTMWNTTDILFLVIVCKGERQIETWHTDSIEIQESVQSILNIMKFYWLKLVYYSGWSLDDVLKVCDYGRIIGIENLGSSGMCPMNNEHNSGSKDTMYEYIVGNEFSDKRTR